MPRTKLLSALLTYISVAFVVAYLIQLDFLNLPSIRSPICGITSVILLVAGHLCDAASWHFALRNITEKVNYRGSFVSAGLSILGKYAPGKIWLLLGRTLYLNAHYRIPQKATGFFAIYYQLIVLIAGAGVGSIFFITCVEPWNYLSLISVCSIVTLYSRTGFLILLSITDRALKGNNILKDNHRKSATFTTLSWLMWCYGFYFLIVGFYPHIDSTNNGFAFAIAAICGILAVIFPGGIGVREGALVAILHFSGIDNIEAITLSVLSRVWFLIGELVVFFSALTLHWLKRYPIPEKSS